MVASLARRFLPLLIIQPAIGIPVALAASVNLGNSGARCDFGVIGNANLANPDILQEVKASGASRTRISVGWKTLEPLKGEYRFDKLDNTIDKALSLNIKPLVQINTSKNRDGFGYDDFARFMRNLARHLRGRVSEFEIFNEVNLSTDLSPEEYAEYLKQAYQAIHSQIKNAIVISAATGSGKNLKYSRTEWFERMLELRAFDYADGFGVHPYSYPATPLQQGSKNGWWRMENLWAKGLDGAGYNYLPFWATEFGEPTTGNGKLTEEHQAQSFQEALQGYQQDSRIKALYFHILDDKDYNNNAEDHFGIRRIDGSHKPSYDVLKNCSKPLWPVSR